MKQNQSSLGSKKIHRAPSYSTTNIGRVTSAKKYKEFGIVDVVFLDYGHPFPVWVINDIEREPVEGDQVVIGYIDQRKDSPYLAGFVKNYSYTTNFAMVSKSNIRLQLPIYDIGVKDGISEKDVKEKLLDDTKLDSRAYVDITPDHAKISFPTSKDGSTKPTKITITALGVEITNPTKVDVTSPAINLTGTVDNTPEIKTPKLTATDIYTGSLSGNSLSIAGGTRGVARLNDQIQVDVGGTLYTGKITTASTTAKID